MSKKNTKRMSVAALLIAVTFAASQSFDMKALASTITGFDQTSGTFNISPEKLNNGAGMRSYTDFDLTKGDVANLIFNYNGNEISRFVNLVQNQISIDGLVNTVNSSGAFHNGEAVFVSPNGMVVGANGVLNVGSLQVLTPTASGMKMYKNGEATLEQLGYHGNANITINGKVLSRGDVAMVGRDIAIPGTIVAGSADTSTVFSSSTASEALFNSLVKTSRSSDIELRSYNRDNSGTAGINVSGTVNNLGNGDITLVNRGKGITTTGTIGAYGGDVNISNVKGDSNIGGTIKASNDVNVFNSYQGKTTKTMQSGALNLTAAIDAGNNATVINNGTGNATIQNGSIKAKTINVTARNTALAIDNETFNSTGTTGIYSNGTGLTLGTVTGSGTTKIANTGANGITINGAVNNTGSLAITNRGNGGFTIASGAAVKNTNGNMNLTNTEGKFTHNGTIESSGSEMLVQNVGSGGFDVNGAVNAGSGTKAYIQNTQGTLKVAGNVTGTGSNLVYIGNTGAGGININSDVSANSGKIQVVNTGAGGTTLASGASVKATGSGTVAMTNRGGDFAVNGNVATEKGNMNLTSTTGKLAIADGVTVGSTNGGELTVQSTGTNGLEVNGTIDNNGTTYIYNKNGDLTIAGKVNTAGATSITNAGNKLTVAEGATVTNTATAKRTYITNRGNGGMEVNGNVTGKGHVLLTNRAGGMNITSDIKSDSNVVLTNSGDKAMTIPGTVSGQKITATGTGSDIELGDVTDSSKIAINATKKAVVQVTDGSLLNAGVDGTQIKSGGNLFVNVKNGSIGEAPAEPGIGEDAVDYTKSVNVNVAGKVKAFTSGTEEGAINIAAKTGDLNVNRIKGNGDVYLTAEEGSILNASTNLDTYANVNGKSVQMIAGGSVGTADKALHFRQTDSSRESNVLAKGDINLHQRGEVSEAVNFNTIKSKTGSVTANMIKSGKVATAAAKDTSSINITARKQDADLTVTNKKTATEASEIIKDYFD